MKGKARKTVVAGLCMLGLLGTASVSWGVSITADVGALNNADPALILTGTAGVALDALPIRSSANSTATINGTNSQSASTFVAGDYALPATSSRSAFVDAGTSGQFAFADGAPLDPANANAFVTAGTFGGCTASANAFSDVMLGFSVATGGTVNYNIDYDMAFTFTQITAQDQDILATAHGKVYFELGTVTLDQAGSQVFTKLASTTTPIEFTTTVDLTAKGFNDVMVAADPLAFVGFDYTLLNPLTGTFGDNTFGYIYAAAWGDATASSVPEPGTFVLVGAGLFGLAVWRRRKA